MGSYVVYTCDKCKKKLKKHEIVPVTLPVWNGDSGKWNLGNYDLCQPCCSELCSKFEFPPVKREAGKQRWTAASESIQSYEQSY